MAGLLALESPLQSQLTRDANLNRCYFKNLCTWELLYTSVPTTSYHPQSNGMVERFHRQLKAALMCHNDTWYRTLPLVLLGIRTSLKEDLKCSSAELLYGETLRLPGEFLAPSSSQANSHASEDFVTELRRKMVDLRPTPASRHCKQSPFVFRDLKDSTHIFLRDDTVRRSLQPPYTGPFKVINRSPKTITIDVSGKPKEVSIDRTKPAYLASDPDRIISSVPQTSAGPTQTVSLPVPNNTHNSGIQHTDLEPANVPPPPVTTRSGRRVKFKPIFDL